MLAFVAVVALPTPVASASSAAVVIDCSPDGSIDGNYSVAELKGALGSLPADVDQYSDCRSLIQQALLDKISKKHDGDGRDSGIVNRIASAGQKRRAAEKARRRAAQKLADDAPLAGVGNAEIERSGARTLASTTAPGVPIAPIIALIGMGLLLAGDVFSRIRRPTIASALRRRVDRTGS